MGNQDLESKRDESEEESGYRIKTYPAAILPIEYKNVVIAPFLNSLRYGNDLFKLIDKEAYYLAYARFIESLLQRPNTSIRLAVLKDETILGWCMHEEKIVHYVWVKKEIRRQGIGRALLPKEFDTFSHITNIGLSIWGSKYKQARFNPF